MGDVKRYDSYAGMDPASPEGQYVRYEDYAKLRAERDAAVERLERERDHLRESPCSTCGTKRKERTACGHSDYWTTVYGNCMACRAGQAELENARLRAERDQLKAENGRMAATLTELRTDSDLRFHRHGHHCDYRSMVQRIHDKAVAALAPSQPAAQEGERT